MRILKDRRRTAAWKLRVYVDAIKDAEATTDATWIDRFALAHTDDIYIPRNTWIEWLKSLALREVELLVKRSRVTSTFRERLGTISQ